MNLDHDEYRKLSAQFRNAAKKWIGGRLYESATYDDIDDIAHALMLRYIDPKRDENETIETLLKRSHAEIASELGLLSVKARNFSSFVAHDTDDLDLIDIENIFCAIDDDIETQIEQFEQRIEREQIIDQIDAEIAAVNALSTDALVSALHCKRRSAQNYANDVIDALAERARKKLRAAAKPSHRRRASKNPAFHG